MSSSSSSSVLTLIPCKHYGMNLCNCLTEEEKNAETHILRYHNMTDDECELLEHEHFEKNGYYQVEKPTWKYSCKCPYVKDDPFIQKVEELMKLANLKCTCITTEVCPLCKTILDMDKYDFKTDADTEYDRWITLFEYMCYMR